MCAADERLAEPGERLQPARAEHARRGLVHRREDAGDRAGLVPDRAEGVGEVGLLLEAAALAAAAAGPPATSAAPSCGRRRASARAGPRSRARSPAAACRAPTGGCPRASGRRRRCRSPPAPGPRRRTSRSATRGRSRRRCAASPASARRARAASGPSRAPARGRRTRRLRRRGRTARRTSPWSPSRILACVSRGRQAPRRAPGGLQAELERLDPVALVGRVDAVLGQREAADDRRDAALGERGRGPGSSRRCGSPRGRCRWRARAPAAPPTSAGAAGSKRDGLGAVQVAARARRPSGSASRSSRSSAAPISSLRWPRREPHRQARLGALGHDRARLAGGDAVHVERRCRPSCARAARRPRARRRGGRRPRPAAGRRAAAAPRRRAPLPTAARGRRAAAPAAGRSPSGSTAASSRCRTWTALSAAPPNSPEWAGRSPVVRPRGRPTPCRGCRRSAPACRRRASRRRTRSPRRRRARRRPSSARRCRPAVSSSPSIRTRTLTPQLAGVGQLAGDEQQRQEVALVVGGAAGVEAAVADVGLERRRRPARLVAGVLDVVVAVDQDRRRAVAVRAQLADDERRVVAVARRARRCRRPRRSGAAPSSAASTQRLAGCRRPVETDGIRSQSRELVDRGVEVALTRAT